MTTSTKAAKSAAPAYCRIPDEAVPAGVRFDVPRRCQGQMVEVAYAAWPRSAGEADDGDEYRRITDHSDGSVTYFRATAKARGE